MNDATLEGFRQIAAAMQTEPTDWQWIGPHLSQRMFGITEARAKQYAARHGGQADRMKTVPKKPPQLQPGQDVTWLSPFDGWRFGTYVKPAQGIPDTAEVRSHNGVVHVRYEALR